MQKLHNQQLHPFVWIILKKPSGQAGGNFGSYSKLSQGYVSMIIPQVIAHGKVGNAGTNDIMVGL